MNTQTSDIELLALDLDGTLVGSNLTISPAVKRAVQRAIARGVHVSIVTGRMFTAALPYALELELDGEIACYQGAAIYDVRSAQRLREVPLEHAITWRVTERALADGMHVQLYHDDTLYVQAVNEWSELYAHLARVTPVVVDSLLQTFAHWDSTKVVLVAEPARAAEYLAVVNDLCGESAYVTRSQPEFIEILDRRVDKGEALRWIAARAGRSIERALAVGDSWNDAPLLDAAAFGVAMGSAPPELMARADAVVGDVGADGVAEAIERYVLR